MSLLFEEQTSAIRALQLEFDGVIQSLKKIQEDERARFEQQSSSDLKNLTLAHAEQEKYLQSQKEYFKTFLTEENEQKANENEEAKKKVAMSNLRLKQGTFFQHSKEQQQQLEKRKKLNTDCENLFDQRKQLLAFQHEKNVELLRSQARSLKFMIDDPSLVEKMEKELTETFQRELEELQEALEKEKQRLDKEYETRLSVMIDHQKQLKEELLKEEEEANR